MLTQIVNVLSTEP